MGHYFWPVVVSLRRAACSLTLFRTRVFGGAGVPRPLPAPLIHSLSHLAGAALSGADWRMIWSRIFLALSRSHPSDIRYLEQGIWRRREDNNCPSPHGDAHLNGAPWPRFLSDSVARSVAHFFSNVIPSHHSEICVSVAWNLSHAGKRGSGVNPFSETQ